MKDYFYSYKDIVFNQEQVVWIIFNLKNLGEGYWPVEHIESGYIEDGLKSLVYSNEAYYVKAVLVAAEVEARLAKCYPLDAEMVLMKYQAGLEDWQIAVDKRLSFDDYFRRLNRCLRYCTGWQRKPCTYRHYLVNCWRRCDLPCQYHEMKLRKQAEK